MSPRDNAQVGACRLKSTEPSEGGRGEGDGIGSHSGLGGRPRAPREPCTGGAGTDRIRECFWVQSQRGHGRETMSSLPGQPRQVYGRDAAHLYRPWPR